jgi:DNA-binding IscR family transcriptional regulator
MERIKMQISSRFTVALHIFTCVDTFKDEHKVTSDFLASSINTNPVIIRKILTQLKNAGTAGKRSLTMRL